MKQLTFLLTLFVLGITWATAQTPADSIRIKPVFGGYQFYQGEKRLTVNQLTQALQVNQQAYTQIKKAKTSLTMATILGGVGGFMVGWPIGTAIAGGEANWAMAGIGAGIIAVSIPISSSFNRQAKNAVATFNGDLHRSSFWQRNELKLQYSGNGVGLALQF